MMDRKSFQKLNYHLLFIVKDAQSLSVHCDSTFHKKICPVVKSFINYLEKKTSKGEL
jgi:hypothetical protein